MEDVEIDGELFRRMVFGSSRSLVQSEVKLIRKKTGKSSLPAMISPHHSFYLACSLCSTSYSWFGGAMVDRQAYSGTIPAKHSDINTGMRISSSNASRTALVACCSGTPL